MAEKGIRLLNGDCQWFGFVLGLDIETLKKRCLKETGLQPPRQPEFQTWALKLLEGGKDKAAASGSVKVKRAAGKKAVKKSVKTAVPKPKAKAKAKAKAKTKTVKKTA